MDNEMIPKGWVNTTLGEIVSLGHCEIRNTLREPLSSNVRSGMSGPYPYYGAASQIDSIDDFRFEGKHLLIAEDGTVTVNGRNPMLQLVDGRFWVSNHSHVFRANDDWKIRFLYFLLSNVNITPYITGAVQPKLSKENLFKIQFPFPLDEYERKAITDFLSSFDDKIELLRKQNETLEKTASALFSEWFGKYKVDGELPEGWRVGKLDELVKHLKTPVLPQKRKEESFFHYSIPAFDDGMKPGIEKGATIMSNKYLVFENSFLVSKLNPSTPRVWTVFGTPENSICSTEFQVIKPKNENGFSYLWGMLNSKYFTDKFASGAQGTSGSHQRARPQDILDMEVVIPDDSSIQSFNELAITMIRKTNENIKTIGLLSENRDVLLPKLMSGEVRIFN